MLVGSPDNKTPYPDWQVRFICQLNKDHSQQTLGTSFNDIMTPCPYGLKNEVHFPVSLRGGDLVRYLY